MTAPTAPWTTAEVCAYLMSTTLKTGTNFTATSTPNTTMVTTFIGWISSQIEMQFSMAGYLIPLAELSGETWPSSQTTYLQLVATLGSVAMAGGYSQRPLPAVAPGRISSSGNVFQDLYNAELNKIYNMQTGKTYLNFRARYGIGTPAQEALTDPQGPSTDFMEGYFDPEKYYDNWMVANKVLAIQQTMVDMDINWDYMYRLLNRGLGGSVYESNRYDYSERVL